MIYPGQYERVEYPPTRIRWIDRHAPKIVGILTVATAAVIASIFVVVG